MPFDISETSAGLPLRFFFFSVILLSLCGCGEAAPRDETLPRYLHVADFSKETDFLLGVATNYGTIEGDPTLNIGGGRSTVVATVQQIGDVKALGLDYKLEGTFTRQVYAGLWISLSPYVFKKDWSSIGFELRASPETGFIDMIALEAILSDGMFVKRHCSVPANDWIFCVTTPTDWAETGNPTETQRYIEVKVSLARHEATPTQGTLFVRRVYLLATESDIPLEILLSQESVLVAS